MFKKCEYCGKEFAYKNSLAKYCSLNCRCNATYHRKNPNAVNYVMGRTEEEKKKYKASYQRNKYHQDKKFREYHKKIRMESYYRNNVKKVIYFESLTDKENKGYFQRINKSGGFLSTQHIEMARLFKSEQAAKNTFIKLLERQSNWYKFKILDI